MAEETRVLIRFDETSEEIPPHDEIGSLGPFSSPGALIDTPDVVDGFAGRARHFQNGTGLLATDAVTGGTLLARDVSVQMIIAWDPAAQDSAGEPGAIIARGDGTGLAEYMPFALELAVVDASLAIGELRWLWHDSAGALKTQPGGHLKVPSMAAGEFMMLTATRRWVSSTEVVMRYYAGAELIAEVASADGDIGGGTTGTTSIGTRYDTGTAAYYHFLEGDIDELRVCDYELSAEEIEMTWRRLSELQPAGEALVRALMPPDARGKMAVISTDPGSDVQVDLRIAGQALGFAAAQVENVRQNLMPDRAYGPVLRQWESIAAVPVRGGDSYETRRARVLAHLRSRAGCSIPGVRQALRTVAGCAPEQLEILSFSSTIIEPFDSIDELRWWNENPADWTILAGAARVQTGAVAIPWVPDLRGGRMIAMSVVPRELKARFKLTPTALPDGAVAGITLWSASGHDAFFFGIRNNAAVYEIGWERWEDNVQTVAFTVLDTSAAVDHWFRVAPVKGEDWTGDLIDTVVSYSTTDADTGFTDFTVE